MFSIKRNQPVRSDMPLAYTQQQLVDLLSAGLLNLAEAGLQARDMGADWATIKRLAENQSTVAQASVSTFH